MRLRSKARLSKFYYPEPCNPANRYLMSLTEIILNIFILYIILNKLITYKNSIHFLFVLGYRRCVQCLARKI